MVRQFWHLGLGALACFGVAAGQARADPTGAVVIGVAAGAAIAAGELFQTPQPDAKRAHIIGGGGGFDIIARDNLAGSYQFEYRPGWQIWRIKPMIGMFGTTDGGVAGYVGVGYDLHITKNIVVNLNTAVTFYSSGGGKRLGSFAVLRSGVEFGWRFENASRLSVSVHHLSHAGLLGDKNPGTEVVAVTYAVPVENLAKLFGR